MPAMVPVQLVAALCNPLLDWPWCSPAPSPIDLAALLASAPLEPSPVETTVDAARHIGRIRYLALNGWTDAIEVDVGVPALGYDGPAWPVLDGNHRLAAALYRGDAEIAVDVAGQLDHAALLLGIPEEHLAGSPATRKS